MVHRAMSTSRQRAPKPARNSPFTTRAPSYRPVCAGQHWEAKQGLSAMGKPLFFVSSRCWHQGRWRVHRVSGRDLQTLQSELPPPSLRKPGAVLLNTSGMLGNINTQLANVPVWSKMQQTSLEPLLDRCWSSKAQASPCTTCWHAQIPMTTHNPPGCPTARQAAGFGAQFALSLEWRRAAASSHHRARSGQAAGRFVWVQLG